MSRPCWRKTTYPCARSGLRLHSLPIHQLATYTLPSKLCLAILPSYRLVALWAFVIDSKEVLRRLKADGWEVVVVRGSHYQLKHPARPGRVTVKHPARDYPIGTLKSMERQSGVRLR
jgi:predicted RNA binding protein YcfA (HicA-like mRNA interferase family)